jgi:hypothetical protein
VVVEIKQQPRRGRAATAVAEKRESDREAAVKESAAVEPEKTEDAAQVETPESA